jgi:transcriptional regulator with XRE-family HTH domain
VISEMEETEKKTTPKDVLIKKIGERMVELRNLEGYKNYENYAYDKGINRSQYGKYEKGRIDIRISSLIKVILSYKEMTVEKFFKGIEIPEEFIKSIKK